MVIILAYDGHIRNTENVGPNMFITFTIVGAVEFPADLLTMVTMEKLGRRHTVVWSLILSGVVCLIIALVPPGKSMQLILISVAILYSYSYSYSQTLPCFTSSILKGFTKIDTSSSRWFYGSWDKVIIFLHY